MIFTSPQFLSGLLLRRILCAAGCSAILTSIVCDFVGAQSSSGAPVTIHKRFREETPQGTFTTREKTEQWNP